MKNEVFEDVCKKLNLEKNKWLLLSEIDSIILDNGIGIYPDWKHLRFFITDKGEILIQHGTSKPYGARLSNQYQLSINYDTISFLPGTTILTNEYHGSYRLPKEGDILVATSGKNKVVGQMIISSVKALYNIVMVLLPMEFKPAAMAGTNLSFYDPSEYDESTCIHGTEEEGIYMKFSPNSGKRSKICGVFHEIIKIKNIKEINLKLNTPYKVFKLE